MKAVDHHAGADGELDVAALRDELLARQATDQEVREATVERWPGGALIDMDDPLHERWMQVDRDIEQWLRETLDRYGWPPISAVGEEAANAAWLLAQHADDLEFQVRCHNLMRDAAAVGEADRGSLAYLSDRVDVRHGRPQRYGTQHEWRDGRAVPSPIADPDSVDARRAAVGLPTLAEGTAAVNETYRAAPEPDAGGRDG